ncbi:III, C31 subunit of DNA-directed RNA polymerase [Pleurostoma richardsiae]|uniref:DNA-directed RNA polymerase III subunit n=1 Tax=Pleurostoma richardsiae TaxID=41990 RepID=A0AA38RXS3_9PEZI|nr:III, C31 subunit of DNA-directed RNA polymerase [Pleurostoma richardsiae]
MSRGGRGGGRGGRGGGRGGLSNTPWQEDPNIRIDGRPSELFPPYDVPIPAPLTEKELKQVEYFLLFREQTHDGPLYTQARTWNFDPSTPAKAYGQEQINQRYGVKNKATVDPFTAMPMYSQKLGKVERALPDLAARPFNKELFPPELHATLDGEDGPGAKSGAGRGKKRAALTLSSITSLRTAEEIFNQPTTGGEGGHQKAVEMLDKLNENDEDGNLDIELNGDEDQYDEDMDEEFDDEDAGDYDAEAYFDAGGEDDYDEGGGDDEGTF